MQIFCIRKLKSSSIILKAFLKGEVRYFFSTTTIRISTVVFFFCKRDLEQTFASNAAWGSQKVGHPCSKRIKAKSISINHLYIENIFYKSKWLNHNDKKKGNFLCASQKSMDFKIMS